MLSELRDLFLPQRCIQCDVATELWCQACRAKLTPAHVKLGHGLELAVLSHADPAMMRAIALWKDAGVSQLVPVFAQDVTNVIEKYLPAGPVDIVTIPSRKGSVRRRGYEPMRVLSEKVAAANPDRWQSHTDALMWTSQPREQRGLSDGQRAANVGGRMSAVSLGRGRIVLLDDVVTSGATLVEALRALRCAGNSASLVVTLAMPRKALGQELVNSIALSRFAV